MGPPNIFQLCKSQQFVEKGTLSCAEKSAFWEQRIKRSGAGWVPFHVFKSQHFETGVRARAAGLKTLNSVWVSGTHNKTK